MLAKIPNGYKEIIEIFGPIDEAPENQVTFDLPYPLFYEGKEVHRATGHKLAVDNFVAVFEELKSKVLQDLVKNYGGIYAKRSKRNSTWPSLHSWGIAIDIEPEEYPLGSAKRMPDAIVEIFRKHGFFYGGDLTGRKDPQHFQLAGGV